MVRHTLKNLARFLRCVCNCFETLCIKGSTDLYSAIVIDLTCDCISLISFLIQQLLLCLRLAKLKIGKPLKFIFTYVSLIGCINNFLRVFSPKTNFVA